VPRTIHPRNHGNFLVDHNPLVGPSSSKRRSSDAVPELVVILDRFTGRQLQVFRNAYWKDLSRQPGNEECRAESLRSLSAPHDHAIFADLNDLFGIACSVVHARGTLSLSSLPGWGSPLTLASVWTDLESHGGLSLCVVPIRQDQVSSRICNSCRRRRSSQELELDCGRWKTPKSLRSLVGPGHSWTARILQGIIWLLSWRCKLIDRCFVISAAAAKTPRRSRACQDFVLPVHPSDIVGKSWKCVTDGGRCSCLSIPLRHEVLLFRSLPNTVPVMTHMLE
jgi:hypothetical protein